MWMWWWLCANSLVFRIVQGVWQLGGVRQDQVGEGAVEVAVAVAVLSLLIFFSQQRRRRHGVGICSVSEQSRAEQAEKSRARELCDVGGMGWVCGRGGYMAL
ncbi:hypothetical protein BZA05DRAFT_412795 [Tricharina praecox]|uniref:uncharacterized protein n=1 Tax=Tricharina praecox TaxID=43433 RepID=UPI00222053AB|nr:uncharacterized protein BZA05DRAFT_412795 [Tricharina praecox]KAI5841704.1 hypothetical protein BZA05DRAFT_412795 [Tricharina praecox]